MFLHRILVSTISRDGRYYFQRLPQLRSASVTLGAAALALSATGAGLTHLDSERSSTIIEPATSVRFPATLQLASDGALPELTLLGVGVGVATFLRIKIYSAAFYADITNPNLRIPSSASPEEKLEYIVRNTACVLRIVPTRNTTYSHLRDGFVRTLQMRHWAACQAGEMSSDDQFKLQAPIVQLRSALTNTPFTRGTPLDLLLTPPDPKQPRALIFRGLGTVQNGWIGRELILSFFDKEDNNLTLKQSVFNRVTEL